MPFQQQSRRLVSWWKILILPAPRMEWKYDNADLLICTLEGWKTMDWVTFFFSIAFFHVFPFSRGLMIVSRCHPWLSLAQWFVLWFAQRQELRMPWPEIPCLHCSSKMKRQRDANMIDQHIATSRIETKFAAGVRSIVLSASWRRIIITMAMAAANLTPLASGVGTPLIWVCTQATGC